MTAPRSIVATKRRAHVMALRLSGMKFEAIAQSIREDPGNWGVGPGYVTQHAYRDLRHELADLRHVSTEQREEARQIEVERLDIMLKKLWDEYEGANISTLSKTMGETQGPALWILDRILKIQERRAKYLGLDAPAKHTLSFDDSVIGVLVDKLLAVLTDRVQDPAILSLIGEDLKAIDWQAVAQRLPALTDGEGDDNEASVLSD